MRRRSSPNADFVGSANLIGGRLKSAPNGPGPVFFETAGGVMLQARASHPPRGDEDRVAVRTAYIDLAAGPPNGAPNAAAGTIRQRLFHGDFIQYIVDWPAGQLTVRRPPTADRNVRGGGCRCGVLRRRALRAARNLG